MDRPGEREEQVPTEPGEETGGWAPVPGDVKGQWESFQAHTGKRDLNDEEKQGLHRLTSQRHIFHGRWVMVAGTFITILTILIGAGALVASKSMTVAEAKDLFPILLPPLFTLLGTAAALYFNSSDR